MLTNRDRRRFERVAARAKRPSGRASVTAMLGRLSTRSLLVGLTLVAVAVGLGGFYASRSALEPRNADLALGGRPTAAPEPVQEPARPAETKQANPPETQEAKATDPRQAHLRQLQPVLRTDADRMSQVARRVRAEGRLPVELRSLFTSHRVLSADLHNHYPEYSEAKERLRKSVTEQEEEFQQTIQLVTTKLALAPVAEPRRSEVAWALLEKCLARGPGMTLTTRPDGYQYTVRGRTQRYSGGAAVAEDEGAAFAAFTSFTPEPEVVGHCDTMKKRAAGIVANAEKLSADALVLAEQPTLSGECKYTKPD
ncbi:MAG: hypothetical protein DMD75_01100 [Candidatus Rokuibacteriota bacterium]|nr:MAG: hypothetical protein DMD75_01100 [Candidatus Rokubacteria bacterium]